MVIEVRGPQISRVIKELESVQRQARMFEEHTTASNLSNVISALYAETQLTPGAVERQSQIH